MNYEKLGNLNSELGLEGCFIAGGAVLSRVTKQPIADYDVYPKSREAMLDIFAILLEDGYVVNLSDRAATFKLNNMIGDNGERMIVQVIIGEFTFPRDIFDCFDFTVCMGAYDVDQKKYFFDDRFWIDVASKDLVFNPGTLYPLNSLIRVNKYKAKGYHISKPQMVKMILTCMNSQFPSSWEDLESQIGGTYGRQIKINSKDLEFNMENIFTVLDGIHEFHDSGVDEYSNYTEEELELYYGDKTGYKVYMTPASTKYFSSQREFIVKEVRPDVYSICDIKSLDGMEFPELTSGHILGYKRLRPVLGTEHYLPAVRGTSSKVTYTPGQETRVDPNDYNGYGIYAFRTSRKASAYSDEEEFKVYIPVEDIMSINNSEIITKSMKVGEKV